MFLLRFRNILPSSQKKLADSARTATAATAATATAAHPTAFDMVPISIHCSPNINFPFSHISTVSYFALLEKLEKGSFETMTSAKKELDRRLLFHAEHRLKDNEFIKTSLSSYKEGKITHKKIVDIFLKEL